jgi:EAL domain-containing protein (putative c-di-GMP-specific phosphodiesterase class I)
VFQPIVSLTEATIIGYEALARFEHPVSRTPVGWFQAARRVGLGPQLEALAIANALSCPDRPSGTFLSLNLSPTAALSDEVEAVLPRDLTDLVSEIAEQESLPGDDTLQRRLRELRARGARIALDDAGAGYAGLQAVMRIAPDVIKLDRTLITGLATDPARLALVEALASFAQRTGSTLCAEGVETREDRETLCRLDVTLGQGYFFARPQPHWTHIAHVAQVPALAHGRAQAA